MTTFLHTMVRITDPERSRAFYEALGFRFSREMDIVRDGEREATNYFFSLGDTENVLELTYNHDGRSYDMGTAYGHIAIGVDNLDETLAKLRDEPAFCHQRFGSPCGLRGREVRVSANGGWVVAGIAGKLAPREVGPGRSQR